MASEAAGSKGRCPICGKPSVPEFAPFCSARCKDIDLNRWLSGAYAIPTDEEPVPTASREDDDDT